MEKAEWIATRKRIRLLTFAGKFISKHSYKSSTTHPPRLNSTHRHVTPNSSAY